MKKTNLFLLALFMFIMLIGCPNNTETSTSNNNSQKISNLQTKINNASEGDVINFSGKTLANETVTVNKAVTIKGGNFSGGTLKVSTNGVALQNVSNANVATSSSMKISDSSLSSLTICSTNDASSSLISRSGSNTNIDTSITITGGSTAQITMSMANACLALNNTTAAKVEISAAATGATLAVSGKNTKITEINANSDSKIVADENVELPKVDNVSIITIAANAQPKGINVYDIPTSFYTDQTPNFAGVSVIGTYSATQDDQTIEIMKPVQNYKIYLSKGTSSIIYYENGISKDGGKLSAGSYKFWVEITSNLKKDFNITITKRDNGGNNNGGTSPNINWGSFNNNVLLWDSKVTNLKAEPGNGSIRVSWTNPISEQFEDDGGILYILYDTSVGTGIMLEGGPELSQKTFNSLTNGTKYIFYIRLWYVDEDAGKMYATAPQSVEATPSASSDNTVYLPPILDFTAKWDTEKNCVVLTWDNASSEYIDGYYFYATTTNTKPVLTNYDYESIMSNSSCVGYETIPHKSIEIYLNDDSNPFKLAANTTYYIWALTTGTGDEDEFLYSKWSEMPMATVTTGSASDSGDNGGNGGGTSQEQETESTYLPNATNLQATYDGNDQTVTVSWTSVNNLYAYYVIAALSSSISEPEKYSGLYDIDSLKDNNTGLVYKASTGFDITDLSKWTDQFTIGNEDDCLLPNKTYYIFILTYGIDDNNTPTYSEWSNMPRISVTTGSMSGSSEGGIGETAEGG